MRTTIENTEVTLHYSFERMGRGHYKVICEAGYLNHNVQYTAVTTDSEFIDELSECDSFEEKQKMLAKRFDFSEKIGEDIYFFNFKNK